MDAATRHEGTGAAEPAAWKVGELVRRTGMSVRALRYYDEIGLLSPSRRTDEGGTRLYSVGDVVRLQQIRPPSSLGGYPAGDRGVPGWVRRPSGAGGPHAGKAGRGSSGASSTPEVRAPRSAGQITYATTTASSGPPWRTWRYPASHPRYHSGSHRGLRGHRRRRAGLLAHGGGAQQGRLARRVGRLTGPAFAAEDIIPAHPWPHATGSSAPGSSPQRRSA
jgi:MerR HTH family regulatory protein